MSLTSDLQVLESKTENELYRIIGEQLLSKSLGADEFSDEDMESEAIGWFGQMETRLSEIICKSRIYHVYVKNPERWEWFMIVASLADLISPAVIGISPLAVAALLLKKGLDNLCKKTPS